MAKEKDPLLDALIATAVNGIDATGLGDVRSRLTAAPETAADAADRLRKTEDDEGPAPFLEVLEAVLHARLARAEAGVKGMIEAPADGAHWATPMPAENLYLLVPESRPFAKKVKPEVQIEAIETAVRWGTATDLRLLQIYLKHLEEKKED